MTIVEMYVQMDCSGCENKIRKALKHIKGIHQVDIDRDKQKVTVMGFADQRKILKAMKKTGKVIEPWPFQLTDTEYMYTQYYNGNQINPNHNRSGSLYYFSSLPHHYSSPHRDYHQRNRYKRNGQIGYFHQEPYSEMVKDRPGSYFSDDNALGCSIM